ncbi:DUF2270 domain-containing protein [Salipiger bermudensis]|uniref:DUF2270 domain-containing protein n=1 Tax=Salipiger bermudensis TaxID=344736 RepID=UPI001C997096|nr:DUF2270 domain-containing protein [Salipiger bermudensis]MBY6006328.1 DUF2270 domain-containing protein [Salipiger bermudensis]
MPSSAQLATLANWLEDAEDKTNIQEIQSLPELNAAEIGALAHLYRSEVHRCSVWRTRLDTTTNWAVVTLGVALSISYAAPGASPLPLVLVGILNLFFLTLEARRYRYCDSWRTRFRRMEKNFYAPMLNPAQKRSRHCWRQMMAQDYMHPMFHISYIHALGRRIRRSYFWIMLIQLIAFLGKIAVHPTPVGSFEEALRRADVGFIPGEAIFAGGAIYMASFCGMAVYSAIEDRRSFRKHNLALPDAVY